jgi:hypothetical protein
MGGKESAHVHVHNSGVYRPLFLFSLLLLSSPLFSFPALFYTFQVTIHKCNLFPMGDYSLLFLRFVIPTIFEIC